ncbi:hypothetical protein HOH15_07675, partial [Candidatus Woesearchaeota archaeon]|nr:hypothetical protein [Candidatus Woesearchaeota archaeon]
MHNKHKIAVTLAYLVLLTAISVNLFVLQYGDYDLAGKGYEVAEDCIPYDDQFDVTDLLWTDADNEIKKICLGDYVLDVPITLDSGVENLAFVCVEGTKFIAGASETAIILESGNIEINGCEFEGFGNVDDNDQAAITDDVVGDDPGYNKIT